MFLKRYIYFLVPLVFLLFEVDARSTGAPSEACETLSPRHNGAVAQTDESPFYINVNTTKVENGGIIEVTVQSNDADRNFKGLILQAREDISVYETKGKFIVEDGAPVQPVICQTDNDTVTHNSKIDKSVVNFYYKAPLGYNGKVIITGTVLEKKEIFYEKIKSEQITVDNGQISTETPSTTETPMNNDTFFEACGTTKSCFGSSDNCIEKQSCNHATSIARSPDGPYIFELVSFQTQARYVALGLSPTEFMSDTTVMECVKENNGEIKIYDSWMSSQPPGVTRENVPQTTTKYITSVSNDRMFLCRFERPAETVVKGNTFNLDNTSYHLLLASGTTLNENSVAKHDLGARSSSKRLLGNIQAFGSPSILLYKLHGIFMFIAWIGTSTIGVFLARYYKKQWKGKQIMNKDLWFVGHQTSMILTFLFTMIGFILIFVKIQAWSSTNNPHPILGLITTVLCFIQPIGAVFRPAPDAKNRRWFNWIHFIIGNATHLFAVTTIYFAVSLSKAKLTTEMYYVLITFALYYGVAHIIFSIATEQEILNNSKTYNGDKWKNILLIGHVIVILTITIMGVVLIGRNNPEVSEM